MKKMRFDITMDLAEKMVDDYEKDGMHYIVAIGDYYFAKDLLEDLLLLDTGIGGLIELHDHEWKGYTDEFIVSLTEEGTTVEPAKLEGKTEYLNIEADRIYLLEDCNSKIIPKLYAENDEIYEISFEMGEDECKDCPYCDEEEEKETKCDKHPVAEKKKSNDRPVFQVTYYKDDFGAVRDFFSEVFKFFDLF